MKTFFLKLAWGLFVSFIIAQEAMAQFGRLYTTDNGLSSSLVNQIFQDSRGFIWTATEYGLNRFDGLRFCNYWHISGDTTSIKSNYVCTFFEDEHQNLWVGCIDGLVLYERATDTFREIPMMRGGQRVFPHVTRFNKMHNGELWLSTTGQGMFRMDEQCVQAVSMDDLLKESNYNYQITFHEDAHDNVWIGTEGRGVIRFLPHEKKVKEYCLDGVSDNTISSILEDEEGNLFVGTQKGGLFRYDSGKDCFVHIPYAGKGVVSVYCLAVADGRLLVGTDGQGLKIYDAARQCLEDYDLNSAPFDLSEGKIHTLLQDRDKNLWLGLFQKGIVLLPRQENAFEYYGYKSTYYNPIGQGCVMAVLKDRNGHLWVGVDNEGVYEVGEDGKRLNHYQPDDSPGSVPTTVMCFFEDSEDNFWLGSYTKGLACMNRKNGTCKYMQMIADKKILSVTEDGEKNLYIGTLGSGLYRYNLLTGELKQYDFVIGGVNDLKRDVNYLFCDSDKKVWMAHYGGVSCLDAEAESVDDDKAVEAVVTDCVGLVVMQDAAGFIWAGTTNGLYCFDKESKELRRFTTRDGLPNDVICGICEDYRHNLWISTYKGISMLDVRSNSFINYYAGDGLQGNEFTHGVFCQDEEGRIFFGGMNGITSFAPERMRPPSSGTGVWILDFSIFDSWVHKNTLSGGKPVIDSAVLDADCFRLAHDDNTFSIVFSTLKYDNPEQTLYQYRIKELDPRWFETGLGVNKVTYNNLEPGKYTFSVRAVSHGVCSDVRTIRIEIAPPWYATGWAYCLYALLGILILWFVIINFRARARQRNEIMQREHAQQLNEAKLQFFINISHEIRTPMTLIINPLEKLLAEQKEKGGEPYRTYLMIYRNAQRILRLINQLMDIRKLDKGQMFMKFRETDMVGFIADVMQPFESLARRKKINFAFEHDKPQLKAWVDLNNFDKVLMNILSNAFKFTPEGGDILVSLSTGRDESCKDALRDYFEIIVTDSGIGIDKNKINRIFERFYQIDNDVTQSNFGTGIGLHLSRSLVELHHGVIKAENRTDASGSRFIIRLPLGSAHLRKDELENAAAPPVTRPVIRLDEVLADETETAAPVKARTNFVILVAEDEDEVRSYLMDELSDEYRVTACRNGKEAYELALKSLPDLVISDIMMPEMDGLTLCRKLKQHPNVNHIPVILLTAKSQTEDRLEGMEMGADAYIAKPFHTEVLKGTIANLIANRKILRNKFSGAQQQTDKMEQIKVKSGDEVLMERVMKIVNEQIANPGLNVEMLAAEVGLSRVHIHRKLKELTNLTTRDFIKNVRLQQAAALMKQEDKKMTVSDVAYAVGYTNLSHFSSSFKEKYGMSPKEYMLSKQIEGRKQMN